MSQDTSRGRWITLEGGEGAGKSTQARHLKAFFEEKGLKVLLTREPGGSVGAEQIRSLLVRGDKDRWSPLTETLLLFAARRDHWEKVIKPALDQGTWVICDRFADSTLAYQGYGHGVPLPFIESLYESVIGAEVPDLTYLFDLPVEEGLKRSLKRLQGQRQGQGGESLESRYEEMDKAFHERVRQGFLQIAQKNPQRCHVLNALLPERELTEVLRCEWEG